MHLSPSDRRVISESLKDYGIIAWSFHDLRKADVPVKHSFELEDDTPVYHQPRRLSPKHNEVVRSEIDRMLEAGIITPASSAWSFPVVIATKKDGKPRFCVDYRILNRKIKPDRWPLPRIEEIFDELGGNSLFTTLDLFSGYWQIRMDTACKEMTTFVTRYSTYKFEVMPFGLMNAPSTFQRMMDEMVKDLPFVRAYLDDVVVFSKNMEEHVSHLRILFETLSQRGLKLKIVKCFFAQPKVELLGHIVSHDGVSVDPAKISAIRDVAPPQTASELRSFLGLAGYYRRFIKGFADISASLFPYTSSGRSFEWTEQINQAFWTLKEELTSAPVLSFPSLTSIQPS